MRLENLDRTIALFMDSYGRARGKYTTDWNEWDASDNYFVGLVTKNTRLFLAGDVVLGVFTNGQGKRWPVYGRSGRGYDVRRSYVDFKRYRYADDFKKYAPGTGNDWSTILRTHGRESPITQAWLKEADRSWSGNNRTRAILLDVPRDLTTRSPASADLRAWLDSHERERSACAVGSGSGAFFREDRRT